MGGREGLDRKLGGGIRGTELAPTFLYRSSLLYKAKKGRSGVVTGAWGTRVDFRCGGTTSMPHDSPGVRSYQPSW